MAEDLLKERRLVFGRSVGSRIRLAWGKGNFVLAWVCKRVGVSNTTMTSYLKGETIPDAFTLTEIAKTLNVSPAWLLTGVDDESVAVTALRHEVSALTGKLELSESIREKYLDRIEQTLRSCEEKLKDIE